MRKEEVVMQAFELCEIQEAQAATNEPWHEFLRVPDLSMGLYQLPAGASDPQMPHTEDEVYYIVSGRGQILVDGEDRPVQAGSIVYVAKGITHRFHSIREPLQILVFFAPAEGSQQ